MTPHDREKISRKIAQRLFSPLFLIGAFVLTLLLLVLIFLPVKARIEDRLITPSGYIRGDGYYDFKLVAKDKLTKKIILDQKYPDVYVKDGVFRLDANVNRWANTSDAYLQVCYNSQSTLEKDNLVGTKDGVLGCIDKDNDIFDQALCVQKLTITRPNNFLSSILALRQIFTSSVSKPELDTVIEQYVLAQCPGPITPVSELQQVGAIPSVINEYTYIGGGTSGGPSGATNIINTTVITGLPSNVTNNNTNISNTYITSIPLPTETPMPADLPFNITGTGAGSTLEDIFSGDTITLDGGAGLLSVSSPSNTVTFSVNPGVAIDTTGDALNVLYDGPLIVNGSNELTLQPCGVDEVLQFDGTNWVCVPNSQVRNGLSIQGNFIELGNPSAQAGNLADLLHNTDIPTTSGFDLTFDGAGNGSGTGLASTGNFGLGTLTPQDQLHLTRDLRLENTTGAAVGVINKGDDRFIHNFGTDSTFTGVNSGNFTMTGSQNSGFGVSSLFSNTTGSFNSGLGTNALFSNTTGSFNTASGVAALLSNTTGANNTGTGVNALRQNTTGVNNAAFGNSALQSNQTGFSNSAFGLNALLSNTTSNNAAFGTSALQSNTTGTQNNAFGVNALINNTTANFNNAFGTNALQANTTGSQNNAFGTNALFSNSTGANNVANGFQALFGNTTGSGNTAVGQNAGLSNTTGTANVFVGQVAGQNNTTGGNNTVLGQNASVNNVTGSNNTLVGQSAGLGVAGNSYNRLTAMGSASFVSNTTGSFNAGLGVQAGLSNTTGSENTAIGDASLFGNTTGSQNVALGRGAGNANTTGSRNTYLGYFAGISSTNNLTNSGAIGYNAQVTENNAIMLGGTGADIVEVGIGLTAADTRLDVNGRETVRDLSAVVGQVLCHNGSRNNFLGAGIPGGILGECSVQPPRIANNGLRINTETDPLAPRVQIGAVTTASGAIKAQSNLIFNTEVPQAGFSIAWSGNTANDMFGIGTLPGSVPDPNRLLPVTTSNLNERLDVIGNIENIADPSLNPTPVVDLTNATCVSGALTGINPNYIKVIGRYAYVLNTFSSTIQIFDVFRPQCPSLINTISIPLLVPPNIGLSTMMDVQGHYAYIVQAGNTSSSQPTPTPGLSNQGRFIVVDINNPVSAGTNIIAPQVVSNTQLKINGPQYVRVYGDYAYVVGTDLATNNPSIEVVDISNHGRPLSISSLSLTTTGGWPGSPLLPATAVAGNSYGLFVHDHFIYVASANVLQVIDATNPDKLIPYASGATGSTSQRVFVEGRYAYVLGIDGVIRVFRVPTTPANMPPIGTIAIGTGAAGTGDILVSGRYLYAVNNNGALSSVNMIDVANPALPTSVGTVQSNPSQGSGGPGAIFLNGRYLYVVNGSNGPGNQNNLRVMDVHGIETTSILAHSAEVGSLGVQTSAIIHDNLSVGQGLTVANGITNQGSQTVFGNIENLSNSKFNPTRKSLNSVITDSNITTLGLAPATSPQSVAVQGRYGYVISQSTTSLLVMDLSDSSDLTNGASGKVVGGATLGLGAFFSTLSPNYIYVQGKYAYVTSAVSNRLLILDISNPRAPVYAGKLDLPVGTSPRQVIVSDRYAYVRNNNNGTSNSVMMVDVSNAANPRLVSTIALGVSDDVSSIFVQGKYLYSTLRGNVATGNSLVIHDISVPWAPVLTGTFNQTTTVAFASRYYLPSSVYVQGRYAYVTFLNQLGTITDTGGGTSGFSTAVDNGMSLVAIDISNPAAPTLAGNYSIERPFITADGNVSAPPSVPFFRDAQVYVQGRYAYLSLDNSMVRVIDVTTPSISNPHPSNGFNSIASPQKMVMVGTTSTNGVGISGGGAGTTAPQVATTGPNYAISGRYMYRIPQAGTTPFTTLNSLEVVDLHGIETTSIMAHLAEFGGLSVRDAASFDQSVTVSGGVNVANGLSVSGDSSFVGNMNVTGDVPTAYSTTAIAANPFSITIRGRYGYITNSTGTLQVVDLSNPQAPSIISTFGSQGMFLVDVEGDYAYSANGTSVNFQVFDVSNPTAPVTVGSLNIGAGAASLDVVGRYAYLGLTNGNFIVVDVSNPRSPRQVGTLAIGGNSNGLVAQGEYVYLANQSAGQLRIINVSNPTAPVLTGSVAGATDIFGVKVRGRYAYATTQGTNPGRLYIFDVANPAAPTLTSTFISPFGGTLTSVDIMGNLAYVGGIGQIQVIDISNPAVPTSVHRVPVTGAGFMWGAQVEGRYLYLVDNTAAQLRVFDLGGAYIQQLEAGGIETSNLNVRGEIFGTNASLIGGLSVGQGLRVDGDSGVGGRVNIGGTTTANNFTGQYRTSIIDNLSGVADSAVAAISHLDTGDTTTNNVLRLNVGTNPAGTQTRFMRFYAGSTTDANGAAVGRIRLNAGNVAYETGGADFAERMFIVEGVSTEPGDVIATTGSGNNKGLFGNQLIGVVSDTAGFIGNADLSEDNESTESANVASGSATLKQNSAIVGLLGQISTKVSTIRGDIKKGDPIGASDMPGVGAKMTEKGSIVGYALEDFSCKSEGVRNIEETDFCVGKVKVLVDPSIYNPNEYFMLDGVNFEEGTIYDDMDILKTIQTKIVKPLTILSQKESTTSAVFKVEVAVKSEGLSDNQALNLAISGIKNLDARLAKLEKGVSIDSDGNIVLNGNVKVTSIDADKVEAFELLTKQVSKLENEISTDASESAVLDKETESEVFTDNDGIISSNLKALNKLESEGGLVVGGEAIFNGKVIFKAIVEFIQNVIFKGNVEFVGRATFNKDTAGSVSVKKDSAGVEIVFSRAYETVPAVNATISSDNETVMAQILSGELRFIVTKKTTKGFTIKLNKVAPEDMEFSWTAFVGKGEVAGSATSIESIKTDSIVVSPTPSQTEQVEIVVPTAAISPATTLTPAALAQPTSEPTTQHVTFKPTESPEGETTPSPTQ